MHINFVYAWMQALVLLYNKAVRCTDLHTHWLTQREKLTASKMLLWRSTIFPNNRWCGIR